MKLNPIALALLLAPLAAQAEVTFTPFAAYQWFDSKTIEELYDSPVDSDVKAKEGYALGLGYRFTPAIGVELNYGRTDSNLDEVAPADIEIRNTRLTLDGYYAFNAESAFSPYLLAGVGQGRLKAKMAGEDAAKDTIIDAAVGAFWRFNDHVALRMEARNVYNPDEGLSDQLALLGLEFSPGNGSSPAEPAPEPVAEQAPVEELAAAPVPVVLDADGDGVIDEQDKCAATLAGVAVDAVGCPLDADKDGVPDYLDKCPDTTAGAAVDSTGCFEMLKQQVAIDLNVQFASGKADIQGDASAEIRKVADFMKRYPTANVTIEGHTDSRGNALKNKQLSQKRADALKAELIKLGVDAARLVAVGYGAEKPIADNKTEAGRSQNRRVVASAKAQAETIKMKK